ncbi:hypothetical protein FNF27_07506 [Cafeteria roenbergensis]|uniref:Uncharacterized protein n=1 Tax=Cafeteria roenbergensis TaxID=33653 RepID=A0A5A8DNR1_CAFRO|nr:hypothetical protein FNF27_07506 [Cafeteria roenbergensis]
MASASAPAAIVQVSDFKAAAASATRAVLTFRTCVPRQAAPSEDVKHTWSMDTAPESQLGGFMLEQRSNSYFSVLGAPWSSCKVISHDEAHVSQSTHLWAPVETPSPVTRGAFVSVPGMFSAPLRQMKEGVFALTVAGLSPNESYAFRIRPLSTGEVTVTSTKLWEAMHTAGVKATTKAPSELAAEADVKWDWPASAEATLTTPATAAAAVESLEKTLAEMRAASAAAVSSAVSPGKRRTAAVMATEALLEEARSPAPAGGAASAAGAAGSSDAMTVEHVSVERTAPTEATIRVKTRAGSDPAHDTSSDTCAPLLGGFRVEWAYDSLVARMQQLLGDSWRPAEEVTSACGRLIPVTGSAASKRSCLPGVFALPRLSRDKRQFDVTIKGLEPNTSYSFRLWPLSVDEVDTATTTGALTPAWPKPPTAEATLPPVPAPPAPDAAADAAAAAAKASDKPDAAAAAKASDKPDAATAAKASDKPDAAAAAKASDKPDAAAAAKASDKPDAAAAAKASDKPDAAAAAKASDKPDAATAAKAAAAKVAADAAAKVAAKAASKAAAKH